MTDTRIARRVAWWSLLAMVFLIPLLMSDFAVPGLSGRLSFSDVGLVKLSFIIFLGLTSLAAWATDLLRHGGVIRCTPIDWLILGWLLWVVITTLTSEHRPTSFLGTQGRYEGLVTFAVYAVVYFVALQFLGEEGRVRRLAQVLFCSGIIVAIYGLLQYAGIVSLPSDLPWDETNRAFSTYGNPNILGGFLIFPVVVAFGLAVQERRLSLRLVYWTGLGLCGLALLVTFTRGSWLGGAASLITVTLVARRQRAKMRRADLLPGSLFGAAAITLFVRSLSSSEAVTNIAKRITSIFDISSGSGQSRTEIWRAAANAIEERPAFGWGPDTFGLVFSRFKTADYVQTIGGASGADNAHNYPLHLAAGLGIFGALLFYAIWIWAGVRSFKTIFQRPGTAHNLLVAAFWAAAAGYLLHLVFGISTPGASVILWIALAVVLAPTANTISVPARRFGTAVAAIIGLVAALGIAGQSVALAADRADVAASEEFSDRPIAERILLADQAVSLNPLVSHYRSTAAAVRAEQMRADAALLTRAEDRGEDTTVERQALVESFADTESAYIDAIDFTPGDYANYVNLAMVYKLAGDRLDPEYYELAMETAENGISVMPLGTIIREILAQALTDTGRTDEAIEVLNECLQIDPHYWQAALALAKLYQERGMNAEALFVLESMQEGLEDRDQAQPSVDAAIEALQQGEPIP